MSGEVRRQRCPHASYPPVSYLPASYPPASYPPDDGSTLISFKIFQNF